VSRQQQQQYSFTLGFGFLLRSLWPEQFCFEQQLVDVTTLLAANGHLKTRVTTEWTTSPVFDFYLRAKP
jgi:hypothetical protein